MGNDDPSGWIVLGLIACVGLMLLAVWGQAHAVRNLLRRFANDLQARTMDQPFNWRGLLGGAQRLELSVQGMPLTVEIAPYSRSTIRFRLVFSLPRPVTFRCEARVRGGFANSPLFEHHDLPVVELPPSSFASDYVVRTDAPEWVEALFTEPVQTALREPLRQWGSTWLQMRLEGQSLTLDSVTGAGARGLLQYYGYAVPICAAVYAALGMPVEHQPKALSASPPVPPAQPLKWGPGGVVLMAAIAGYGLWNAGVVLYAGVHRQALVTASPDWWPLPWFVPSAHPPAEAKVFALFSPVWWAAFLGCLWVAAFPLVMIAIAVSIRKRRHSAPAGAMS